MRKLPIVASGARQKLQAIQVASFRRLEADDADMHRSEGHRSARENLHDGIAADVRKSAGHIEHIGRDHIVHG